MAASDFYAISTGLGMAAAVATEPVDVVRVAVDGDHLQPNLGDVVVVVVIGHPVHAGVERPLRVLVHVKLVARVGLPTHGDERLHVRAERERVRVSVILRQDKAPGVRHSHTRRARISCSVGAVRRPR